jgi:hypothetical protein
MRIRGGTLLRLWAIALLILASNNAFAANWYVSTSGNNANDGSTPALAKASINAMVNSSYVGNGDIIFISSGNYTEQVVIGNKSMTLIGDGPGVVIKSPDYADLTPYTLGTALSWNGSGKLSSNTIRPVVFINATSSSRSVNIKNITIDGSTADMPEASTQMLVGLAYRYASGTVGGSGADKVTIKNFNADAQTSGLNNAFGAMILTRSGVTFSHVKVENYRNAGIAVVGENLSTASSVIANQPNPTIIDCEVKGKQINTISSGDLIQSGILIANGARATVKRTLVWQNRTNEANSANDRFAYGIYLYDARTVLIGETTTNKANGNLITDNEIGIYARINSTAVSASGYTIRQNTIAYNGNETPSGKIASYGSETAQYTTYGAIRFNHVPVTNQTLSVTNNAWGNSEAHFFFQANPTSANYTPTNYNSNPVAFWNEDKGDQITFSSPLSPLYSELLHVNEDNSPISARAPHSTNGIGVNLGFGYYNFSQLNRAVYAAREQAGTGNTPEIYVQTNTTEDETAVVTKSIKVYGDAGSDCADQVTITLANNLNMPTIWVYGLNSNSPNSDALTRTPNGITFANINIGGNNIQNNISATETTGVAMLVTGSSSGSNTPTAVQLQSCAIESEFDGSPLAISTDQSGSISRRYAAAPVTIDARFTRRPENCDRLLVDDDVRDNRDDLTLSLILLDDVVTVTNCTDLQNAINAASLTSPRTTIRVISSFTCNLEANSIANVRIETIAPATLTIPVFNLNNGAGSGGNIPVCGIEINNQSSGVTVVNRVNVWPPACLNDAMNIVTDGATNLVVAANANAIDGPLSYTEQYNNFGTMITNTDATNAVYVQKRFDLEGATAGTAAELSAIDRNSASALFTGRFVIQDRLKHDGTVLGIADVAVVSGSVTSSNGTSFGDSPVQVEMKHNRLAADLTNFDSHNTASNSFYVGNIEMAQQFINSSSGSRRMNFNNPAFGTFGSQNARIWTRVFMNGLDNRGTETGIIRLDGAGNCDRFGLDESSVLRNLSVAQVDVMNSNNCIQTALGRVNGCNESWQDIEGTGTNAITGEGGKVVLQGATFNQNVEIAKHVRINEIGSAVTLGAVILRRGAILESGSTIDGFTNTVNMNQCYSAHSNGANPRPEDAIKLAFSSPASVINIAGYGNSNGLGQGSQPRGVWQFSQINVDRDVDFRGFYWGTSATDLNNCANVESTTRPAISSNRDAALETVLGTHDNSSYSFGGGYIFNVGNNVVGFSASGIKFHNVVHGNAGATTIVRLGNNTGNVSFDNNIITGTGNHNLMAGMVHSWGTTPVRTLHINGNHLVINQASFYQIISINDLNDSFGPSNITENVIDVTNAAIGNSMYFENVDNSTSMGLNIASNWVTGSTNGVELKNTFGTNGLDGITIQRNNFRDMFRGIVISNQANQDIGSNNITIKENYINGNNRGLELNWAWTNVTTNRLFVNNNNLANNTFAGIFVEAITDPNGPTTNMFDFRFNYWGSELGPVRGPHVAENPLLAPSDSSRVIGHVPFNHTTGSSIAQHPGQPYGRWMVYPVAVTANDATAGTCGWQYETMQAAVLRVNGDGNQLLGMYDRIGWARDNSNPKPFPVTGPRSGTDQIFVIAQSTYGATFGYNGTVESEGSGNYPIVFDADPEPSVIRGINRPTIYTDESGSISVTSTFPRGFTAKDFINHVSAGSGTYTGIRFANEYDNKVDYNFFTSLSSNPTSYTGITASYTAPGVFNEFTNNRINLGQFPSWPGGPNSAISAPSSFTGIEIPSYGPNGTGFVTIANNEISTGSVSLPTKSVGIFVNAGQNIMGTQINFNQIRGMAANASDAAARTSIWGTGIYVRGGDFITIRENDIQGGNTGGSKAHDGITLDGSGPWGQIEVYSNLISTTRSFSGLNTTTTRERGYGLKIFSSTGSGNIGGNGSGFVIWNNSFGSSTAFAPAIASFYVGGTSGTIGNATYPVRFWDNFIFNATETKNAAIQVATSQYSGTSSAAYVTVQYTDFGTTSSSEDNAMFLAIGTDGFGATRNTQANNYAVSVFDNNIRVSEQTVATSTIEVADGRPNAGANIRNIFGYGTGSTLNGSASTLGGGQSGNNTFSFATILTGEAGLAKYNTPLTRTGNAIAYPSSSDPVVISRLIASPLASAVSTDSSNTVELRENGPNSNYQGGFMMNNENLYYKETLTMPNERILISGPKETVDYAELLPGTGGTGIMVKSNGRENKDIRGAIRFNALSSGLFGQIENGAANKGDVYLQMVGIFTDIRPVLFRYHTSTLGTLTPVTGLNNGVSQSVDIKASFDDADDDSYTANTSTSRRTGVFRSGTAGGQFLKGNTNEGITGNSPLAVYPNPAQGDVTVSFSIPFEGMVRVALYNALGEKVTDLREGNLSADSYTTTFNASSLPSGTYHVRLVHDLYTRTVPVTVIK